MFLREHYELSEKFGRKVLISGVGGLTL